MAKGIVKLFHFESSHLCLHSLISLSSWYLSKMPILSTFLSLPCDFVQLAGLSHDFIDFAYLLCNKRPAVDERHCGDAFLPGNFMPLGFQQVAHND